MLATEGAIRQSSVEQKIKLFKKQLTRMANKTKVIQIQNYVELHFTTMVMILSKYELPLLSLISQYYVIEFIIRGLNILCYISLSMMSSYSS